MVLEKTLESPLDIREIKPVNPKQPWIFIGRTNAEAEASILWPPDVKSRLIAKDLMLGKIEGRGRKERQQIRWLDSISDLMGMSLSKLWEEQGSLGMLQSVGLQSWTWLSNWTTTTILNQNIMAKIGEGNGTPLQHSCLEKSHRRRSPVGCSPWCRKVGYNWSTSLSLFTFMHWRRKWHPTPVFLPGESQGWGSLVGCHLWGRTESDTSEAT